MMVLLTKTFKVIWLYNLSTLSVPDEGYSRNASCALNCISILIYNIYNRLNKEIVMLIYKKRADGLNYHLNIGQCTMPSEEKPKLFL